MTKEKVILAYSGGLDTSVMLKWLKKKGYEIVCYIADVGQSKDFKKLKEKALKTGASKVYICDLKEELIEKYIFEMIKANAIYEGKYLLGTAIARPIIAKKQVEIARKENTIYLAHGCTGKGNDQVRFELTWMKFMPELQIISPWKDKEFLKEFKGRNDLVKYAKQEKIDIDIVKEKIYSKDENIMHISYESGSLEKLENKANIDTYQLIKPIEKTNDYKTEISIEFKKGIPKKIINITENKEFTEPLKFFIYLNKIAGENGIGRIDIVEDRFIGIKSRGVYETPAGTVLYKAHKDLESITLDKELIQLKELFSPIIGRLIYNGFWFSPEMQFLMAAVNKSQEKVNGKIYMDLYKGNIIITKRKSESSLYKEELSSMQKEGGFNQKDAEGFIKINGLRMKYSGE